MSASTRQTRSVQAAITGAGLMGRWHVHAARQAGAHITAIVDPHTDAAQKLIATERLTGVRTYNDLQTLLIERAPDVLHICTPTASHEALIETALAHGLPVIAEKPLAETGVVTARLLALAAKAGTWICPVHQFLFQDGTRRAQEWIPELGSLIHIEAIFHSAGTGDPDTVAADILPHPLALIDDFIPGNLGVMTWSVQHPRTGELRAHTIHRETTITVQISMNARPTIARFSLFGTRAAVHLDLYHGFAIRQPGKVSRLHKIAYPFTTSAQTFGMAGTNLLARAARGESAYPGLRTLIARCYDAVNSGISPIAPENVQATADARDRLIELLRR